MITRASVARSTYSSMARMKNSSRRSFLAKLSALALFARSGDGPATPAGLIYAGTYTDKGSTSQGIYAFRWDADAGTMSPLGLAAATVNPSFLPCRRIAAISTPSTRWMNIAEEDRFGDFLCRRRVPPS